MASEYIFILALIGGATKPTSTSRASIPAPCLLNYSGMVKNITLRPDPPRVASTFYITAELHATRDLQIVTVKGYLFATKIGFRFPFSGFVCDQSMDFCPIAKGEKRSMNYSVYINRDWPVNIMYSIFAKLYDEDDVIIASVSVVNCTVFQS